jgi:site-specific recombinase XerC
MAMKNDDVLRLNDHDFGFSLMDETEIRVAELHDLKNSQMSLEEQNIHLQAKLNGLRDMVMPLLTNLMKDPEKSYLYWPNRVEKIEMFQRRLDEYLKE